MYIRYCFIHRKSSGTSLIDVAKKVVIMEFRQIVFHWIDRSCQPSIVGNNEISFVLLDLFQVMHLAIPRLIWKFLWSRKIEGHAWFKLKWDVITLPPSTWGLCIIDPVDQSRALLSKLIIRGFTMGQERWIVWLLHRCSNFSPSLRAPWSKDANWIFRENFREPSSNWWEAKFIRNLFWPWKQVLLGLLHNKPNPRHYVEYLIRRVVWNPLFTTSDGLVMGSRQWLAWGKMSKGSAKLVRTCQVFFITFMERAKRNTR